MFVLQKYYIQNRPSCNSFFRTIHFQLRINCQLPGNKIFRIKTFLSVFRLLQKNWQPLSSACSNVIFFLSVTSQRALKTYCMCISVATANEKQTENFIAEQEATGVESLFKGDIINERLKTTGLEA